MKFVLNILLFVCSFSAFGQNRILVGGIVTNHLTGEPVQSAHVLNLTDSLATITSEEGAFKIPATIGDSLVFTSIGYSARAIILTEKELLAEYINVKMVQRQYELGEVEVNPLGTKEQFRKKFMDLEVDDGVVEVIGVKGPSKDRRTIPVTEDASEIKKAKYMMSPASFLYGNLSKDAKARQELHRLERERDKHKYNYQKFNEKIVQRITKYEGETLLDFMEFCNFSEQQIFRYSDYELTVAILNKKKLFEQRNSKETTQQK